MRTEVQALISKIEKDKKLLRLEESFENNNYFQIPVKALKNEIESSHRMRPIRTLKAQGPDFAARVIDSLLADQAMRSRMAEINLQAFRVEKNLESGVKAARDYIVIKYANDLNIYKTKEERMRVIDMVLEKYISYIDKVNGLQAMTRLIIDDIDKASWAMKATIEAIKLISKPEATI